MSHDSPGAGWRLSYGYGFDCDDNNPNIKRECYKDYYVDNDKDSYHGGTINNIDDNGGEYKTVTLGRDCNDEYFDITTQCYLDWYQDKDGDGYHSKTLKTLDNPGIGWTMGTSNGVDCNDDPVTGANVHKLNKCGRCETEPVNELCGSNVECATSKEDLQNLFPGLSDTKAILLANTINNFSKFYGIDTKEKMQHFLAQAGHESNNFKTFGEYINHQPKNIMSGPFSDYFNDFGKEGKDPQRADISSIHTTGAKFVDGQKFLKRVINLISIY